VLRQEGLVMEVAGRRTWILVPEAPGDRRAVFLSNYWPVVANVLARYNPSAITGLEAVRLHLGDFTPPVRVSAQHDANRSEYTLELEPGFALRLRPRDLSESKVTELAVPGGARIGVLSAADLLATLDEPEIAGGLEPVLAWLRHLVIRTPDLDRATSAWPRPQILQRLADMAGAIAEARPHRATGEHAAHVTEILDAVAASIRADGRRIEIGSAFELPAPMPWAMDQLQG